MIFRNALLEIEGATHRLLETEPEKNVAWVISMDDFAMPKSVGLSDISGLETIEHTGERLLARVPTEAERSRRDKAVKALRPLLVHGTALFDDVSRFQLIKKHAKVAGVSTPSLYKWLRMYWQNGQCDDALTPNYRTAASRSLRLPPAEAPKPDTTLRPTSCVRRTSSTSSRPSRPSTLLTSEKASSVRISVCLRSTTRTSTAMDTDASKALATTLLCASSATT